MLNELNNFVYENHLGQRFDSLANGVYLNHSNILDYSWNYDVVNDRISRFYRSTTKRSLPLVVIGKTEEEAKAARTRLFEIAEADIFAMLPGKIYVGEHYSIGFITASKKSRYLYNKRYCNLNLEFTSADPAWYLERTHTFLPGSGETIGVGGGKDYPFDYKYDFVLSTNGGKISCNSIGNNAFKLLIYGEAVNPQIVIGGHVYAINGTVGKRETLLIDSLAKTITLTTALGNKINWFDKRGREDYIFEPIPAGMNTVTWLGQFGFNLTVIEKRSEPKWT